MPSPRLVLLSGIPGVETTDEGRRLAGERTLARISPREIAAALELPGHEQLLRLEELIWGHVRELLVTGIGVVLEVRLEDREGRDRRREWARDHDVNVELLVLGPEGDPGLPDAAELALYDPPFPGPFDPTVVHRST